MKDCKLTVFTPTFNRAGMIKDLYHSLQRQQFTDFEWLVIDDGSTDGTRDLFRRIALEDNPFSVRYYEQENGGKHRATNRALDLACGKWFFTVDSDDYLTDDALEKISQWADEIAADPTIKGIVANRGYSETETVNPLFCEPYLDKTLLDMYTYRQEGKPVLGGERAICFLTEFHRAYRYPEFDGENFMTEGVVYNRMAADGYKMRFYNDIIWVFAYRDDGLTKAGSSVFLNNPRGFGLFLREKAKFEHDSLIKRLQMYYTFTCDLSGRYDNALIAECIGAPKLLIAFLDSAHRLYRRIIPRSDTRPPRKTAER